MTLQLHMEDIEANYLKDFTARVVKRGDGYVILDQTAFYPTGGGQEHDTGVLQTDAGPVTVRDVKKKGEVKHILEGELPPEVTEVRGQVDWDRRYAHMRMHTAQHLVSALVYDLFGGARTVGNQIHRERSRIDFSVDSFTDKDLAQIEEDANQLLARRLDVDCYTEERGALEARVKPERSNLDIIPQSIQNLRVIEIQDFDICPCAGTHVRNTEEIGPLRMLGTKSKGKDKTRIEFTLESLVDNE